MIKRIFIVLLIVFCILVNQNISFGDDENVEEIEVVNNVNEKISEEPNINSRIAVVYDRNTGEVVWGKNEKRKSAMASTTKIMTAIIVCENTKLDDEVIISAKAAGTGGSRLGLKKNDKITVKDLLYGLMLRSGNDAAVALAEHVGGDIQGFAKMMNDKAEKLGLSNTHFVTPHGLDSPEHYTTAFELAKITDYALNNETISKIVGTKYYTISINGYSKSLINTNELLGNVSGLYGVKTGFTGNAGRCLVTSIRRDDIDVIVVVLQADTKKDRSKDTLKIMDYIFNNYCMVDIQEIIETQFADWKRINKGRIHINKANNENFDLNLSDLKHKRILVEKRYLDDINIDVNCLYNLESPVSEGTIVGNMKVTVGEKNVDNLYIYIDRNVEKKGVGDYFFECLRKYKIFLQFGL